jgi:hypothetical protein
MDASTIDFFTEREGAFKAHASAIAPAPARTDGQSNAIADQFAAEAIFFSL